MSKTVDNSLLVFNLTNVSQINLRKLYYLIIGGLEAKNTSF